LKKDNRYCELFCGSDLFDFEYVYDKWKNFLREVYFSEIFSAWFGWCYILS